MVAFHAEQGDDLYSDWAIWSPDVPVFRGDDHRLLESPYRCTIMTCAAPYTAALARLAPQRLGEVEPAFRRVVFAVAETTADGRVTGPFEREFGAA